MAIGITSLDAEALYAYMLNAPRPPQQPRAPLQTDQLREDDPRTRTFPSLFRETFQPGTMSDNGKQWITTWPDDFFARQVQEGISWRWQVGPGQSLDDVRGEIIMMDAYPTTDARAAESLTAEVEKLAALDSIRDVTQHADDPRYVRRRLPIFSIAQKDKHRLVWDGRLLNVNVELDRFKMESATTTASLLRSGDYMFTLDMWSGYHQLRLRKGEIDGDPLDMRPFTCFEWQGRTYQWQVLPFGLNVAPQRYQKIMLKLFALWRERGWRCGTYIDDGIWAARSVEELLEIQSQVLQDLERYGLIVNRSKAQLTPAQAVEFLGLIYDTSGDGVRLFVPDRKIEAGRAEARRLLTKGADQARVGGHEIASLVGKILSWAPAFPLARLVTRGLLGCLHQLPLREVRQADGTWTRARNYSASVVLDPAAIFDLQWLEARAADYNGASWGSATATRVLYTDGSAQMRGALARQMEEGREGEVVAWSQGEIELPPDQRGSVQTELEAVLQGLARTPDLDGHTVLLRTDSVATMYGLKNGGYAVASNSTLNLSALKIQAVCALREIRLLVQFVGSDGIIRSGADFLSRNPFDDRTCLRPDVFDILARSCAAEGIQLTCDLFAEEGSSQGGLPFFSRVAYTHEPTGWLGVDALSRPWTGASYAFPPMPLLPVVVEKALAEAARGATVVLVVPHWPQRSWTALLAGHPFFELGKAGDVCFLPEGQRPIESATTWQSTVLRAYLLRK